MTDEPTTRVERAFSNWSARVRRRRRVVLGAAALLTASAAVYTAGNLGVNTDTSSLVSETLDWRRRALEYERAFPDLAPGLTVLIEGATPELANDGARRLARALEADAATFESVYRPDGGRFFDEYALLYRDADSLASLVDRIVPSYALLTDIAHDPTFNGLSRALERAISGPDEGSSLTTALDLSPFLGLLAASTFAASEGRFEPVPWSVLIEGRLPTASERRRTVLLRPRLAFANQVPGRASMRRVREVARELGLDERGGITVRLTGAVAIEADELDTAIAGVRQAGLLAAAAVAFILFVALRSGRLILLSLATLITGLIATSAFAAATIGQLNLISVAFAVLYVGLGIDYALHLCLRYRAERARGSATGPAIDRAVAEVGPSLALSALTTATCFYAFTITDFTGMAELGIIGGTGMLISFIVTLTVLPAGLAALPLRPEIAPLPGGLPRLASAVRRYRFALLLVAAASVAVGAPALPGIRFDGNPLNLRDPGAESVIAYRDLLADSVAKPLTISILRPDPQGAIRTAADLERLAEVGGTRTLESFIPADQALKQGILRGLSEAPGREPAPTGEAAPAGLERLKQLLTRLRWSRSVEERTAARRAFHALRGWQRRTATWDEPERRKHAERLETALVGALPDLLARLRLPASSEPLTRASLPADLTKRYAGGGGLHRVEVIPAASLSDPEALRRFVEVVQTAHPDATGEPVTQIETGRVAASAFRNAMLAAGLITAVMLMILLRSPRAAALVVGPLAVAAVWTGGLMVAFDMQFNYANVIALPLLLGVGVDNGIHMLHHVRRRSREADPLGGSTGRAILFASLTTIASFGNLAFAVHLGMASMGRLLTVGMICVLASTLVVLPAVLRTQGSAPKKTGR